MFQPVSAHQLCRACAIHVQEIRHEEAFKQFQKFRQLYSTLSELKVYDDDDLPKLLCPTCAELFETINNFKEACARSVDSIRKLIVANLKEEPVEEIVSAEALDPILKVEKELELRKESGSQKLHCTQDESDRSLRIQKREITKKHLNLKLEAEQKLSTWCSGCNRTLKSKAHFRRHMEVFHTATGTPNLECPTCQKSFKRAYELKAHIMKSHSEVANPFICAICGFRCLAKCEIQSHITCKHQMDEASSYICHFCGKAHKTKNAIRNHLIEEHTDPVYETCAICGVQVLQSKLMAHCRKKHPVRSDVQTLKCKICGKDFKRNAMLNRHMKIHSDQRSYVCHLCGMAFIRSGSLKRHMYSHSGERPIHCDHCGKGLYSNRALKIHMNIHKREWIAQGQTGIELLVYATSNKSKNSTEKKYANLRQPQA